MRRLSWVGLAVTVMLSAAAAAQEPDGLARVRERGVLEVAVYADFPPYSYKGADGPAGVDVELGRALAQKLGVKARFRLFTPGEDVSDDLRNNVWKGHYLGGGVADVMLHAPVDAEFARRQQQARLFAPYFQEAVALVHRPGRLREGFSPLNLAEHKVGVEIDSISDFYLSGAFNGRLRAAAVRLPSLSEALAALARGEIDAVMGPRGELQGLVRQAGLELDFRQQELAGLFRSAWEVGMAVRGDGGDELRTALQGALDDLRGGGQLQAIFAAHGIAYAAPGALERP